MTTLALRLLSRILSSGGRCCVVCGLHVLADDAIGLLDGEIAHAECAAVHVLYAGSSANRPRTSRRRTLLNGSPLTDDRAGDGDPVLATMQRCRSSGS
jgi:hypothetical protein